MLKIENVKISDIIPYKHNAKEHPAEQVAQIAASIRQFGMNDPVAIDEENVIIEGHGRLLAIQKMQAAGEYTEETVPCIRLTHLTDQQKKAYILAHNKLTMNTGFDLDILSDELERITDFDMSDFGFIDEENEEEQEPHEDDYNGAIPAIPKAKRGDIYKLGEHRLMCGDSTKAEDVEKLMDGAKADLVITDPPYNVKYGTQSCQTNRRIKNDDMSGDAFFLFCKDAFACMNDALKDGGAFYIWYANVNTLQIYNALIENGLKPRAPLTWVKDRMVLDFNDYHSQNEPCIYSWKGTSHYFTDDRTQKTLLRDDTPNLEKLKKEELIEILKAFYEQSDAIHESGPKKSELHPTMKPVKLIARLINNSSRAGELVLDLFGGSGTTMIAAEQLGRRAYLMEIDPHYIDVIIDRWEKATGQTAEKLVEGGE